jgi:phosphatidylserine/phosphatidylglycerophosphate/cardiolipin synthase-like enzyme
MTNILNLNNQTMEFVRSLRREPTMADKAMCDILSHPGGAAHLKMCVMGDDLQATAYTGGIDMQMWRHNPQWHDVQAKVEGPGAQGVFDYFRDIWTEIKGRSVVSLVNPAPGGITLDSHTSGAPALAARSIGTATSGKIHVQCARTLPQFHFSSGALNSATIPTNQPLSFAPNGQLGIKEVWRKGISGGETYIYVEDQGFWSNEVGDWINAQIKAQPNLKVILLAGQSDPNDTANGVDVKMFIRMVNDHLLAGLTAAQIDRVCLAMHSAKTIHAKTTIIDEQWGLIGSANYMRRSLYTDLENSYGFMDEEGRAVGAYRLALWDFHFGAAEPDLTRAIARWFALPTAAPNAQQLKRQPLPMRAATFTAQEQTLIDTIEDVDSRNAWGDALLGLAASATGGGAISGP